MPIPRPVVIKPLSLSAPIASQRLAKPDSQATANGLLILNIDDDLFADFKINLKGVTDLPDNALIL